MTDTLVPNPLISDMFKTEPVYCFTADIDWASEDAISICHEMFASRGIQPTYFVTHESERVMTAWRDGEAECGCHPNFLPGSDHGDSFEEVCQYFDRFPRAWRSCFRSHRFFDVTDISVAFWDRGFTYDSNLFSLLAKLPPYRHFTGLVRFPSCWEDGSYLRYVKNLEKRPLINFLDSPGLTVVGVHPLHMAINSPTYGYNRELKDRLSRDDMARLDCDALATARSKAIGIADLFADVLDHVLARNHVIMTLSQLHDYVTSGQGIVRCSRGDNA